MMFPTEIITESEQQTIDIARSLAYAAKPGDIFCLSGQLGVGKTVFAKGFAMALNIEEEITSPTFTIVNEYVNGSVELCHFDCYRIADSNDAQCFEFEEYFERNCICLIEWPENIRAAIPSSAKHVIIERLMGDKRKITLGDFLKEPI